VTRDANEIAREYERNQRVDPTGPAREPVKPNRGTFNVWEQLLDMKHGADPFFQFEDVTVNVATGVVVMVHENGEKYLYYPRPGMYCEFLPHAGE
jgi:hypothetical protein